MPGDMKFLTQKRTRSCSTKKSSNKKRIGWRRYLLMRDHLRLSPTVRLETKTVIVNSGAYFTNI